MEFDRTATQSHKRINSNQRFDCWPEHGGAENCSPGAEKAPRWHQQAGEQTHKRMSAQTQDQSHKESIRTPTQVTNVKPADQANEKTVQVLCLMERQEAKVTCCIIRWMNHLTMIWCFCFAQESVGDSILESCEKLLDDDPNIAQFHSAIHQLLYCDL